MEVQTILKKLINDIREGDHDGGVVPLNGPGMEVDQINISLARFQSYRGRTTAALLEELEDFVPHARYLEWSVDDILVHLTAW